MKFGDVLLFNTIPIKVPRNNNTDVIRKSFFLIEDNTLLSSTSF